MPPFFFYTLVYRTQSLQTWFLLVLFCSFLLLFFFLVVGLRCRRLRGYAYQGGRPMFEFMKREILLGRRRECRTVDRRPVAIFARGL